MNFFDTQCQEPVLNHTLFGLCDDENGPKAYTNIDNSAIWIATVKNSQSRAITFTAIDKCVIKDGELLGEGRCDCMLTYTNNIIFVELKLKVKEWMEDGIKQIEDTINQFVKTHDLKAITHKRAFVANKRHPNFHTIENATMKRFFDKYRVRLNVEAEIEVN